MLLLWTTNSSDVLPTWPSFLKTRGTLMGSIYSSLVVQIKSFDGRYVTISVILCWTILLDQWISYRERTPSHETQSRSITWVLRKCLTWSCSLTISIHLLDKCFAIDKYRRKIFTDICMMRLFSFHYVFICIHRNEFYRIFLKGRVCWICIEVQSNKIIKMMKLQVIQLSLNLFT